MVDARYEQSRAPDEPRIASLSPDARLAGVIEGGIDFLTSLFKIQDQVVLHPDTIMEAVTPPDLYQEIRVAGARLSFTDEQIDELLRQRFTQRFTAIQNYTSVADFVANKLYSRDEAVRLSIANLDRAEREFITQISTFNPLIATTTAIILGHLNETPGQIGTEYNLAGRAEYGGVIENIRKGVAALDDAQSTVRAIGRVADMLRGCLDKRNGDAAFVDAWQNDMILPVVEAIGHINARVLGLVWWLHEDGAVFYAPNYPLPGARYERQQLADEWVSHIKAAEIPADYIPFLGISNISRFSESLTRDARSLPIPGFMGPDDCSTFIDWMKKLFSSIGDGMLINARPREHRSNGCTKIQFTQNLSFLLRGKATVEGQARFAIQYDDGKTSISIRVDSDRSGLTVDFGNTSAREMLAYTRHATEVQKQQMATGVELIQQLRAALAAPAIDMSRVAELRKQVNEANEPIRFFTGPKEDWPSQMPYFATLLVATGQLLGTRSDLTISHHWRENTSNLGSTLDFGSIASRLGRGLMNLSFR